MMMDSLNKQIEMQDRFNWQIKLAELEEQKASIEAQIENVKRILYGNNAESGAGRSKKKNSADNASCLSGH